MADLVDKPVPTYLENRCGECGGCDGGCSAKAGCIYDRCICTLREALKQAETPQSILEEAQRVVFGPRQGVYGHPRDDFQRTADLWWAYLLGRKLIENEAVLRPEDVSAMMILLKLARLMETPDHRDSIVDIAGYAETMARVRGIDA